MFDGHMEFSKDGWWKLSKGSFSRKHLLKFHNGARIWSWWDGRSSDQWQSILWHGNMWTVVTWPPENEHAGIDQETAHEVEPWDASGTLGIHRYLGSRTRPMNIHANLQKTFTISCMLSKDEENQNIMQFSCSKWWFYGLVIVFNDNHMQINNNI